MPSDDFMDRADDEREMTAIADDIDDLDADSDLDDHRADEEDTDTVTFASLGHPDSGRCYPAAAGAARRRRYRPDGYR